MARYDFGGDGTQAILDLTTGNLLINASDGVAYASLTAVTALVDITSDEAGTTFLDNIATNEHGIPERFYGPDNVRQIAVDFGSGERFLLDSNSARKNALDASATAVDALALAEDAIPSADLGRPNGPAVLDADGRVSYGQLPPDIGTGGGGGGGGVTDYNQLTNRPTIPNSADDINAVPTSALGQPQGVATLDPSSHVPMAQLPVGTDGASVARGDHTHQVPWAWMPPHSCGVVPYDPVTGTYPARPSRRADLHFTATGPVAPSFNTSTGFISGSDYWDAEGA